MSTITGSQSFPFSDAEVLLPVLLLGVVGLALVLVDELDHSNGDEQHKEDDDAENTDEDNQVREREELAQVAGGVGLGVHRLHWDDAVGNQDFNLTLLLNHIRHLVSINLEHSYFDICRLDLLVNFLKVHGRSE